MGWVVLCCVVGEHAAEPCEYSISKEARGVARHYLVEIDDHANSFVAQEVDRLDSCVAVDLSQHKLLTDP
jgi:hypothetical protein